MDASGQDFLLQTDLRLTDEAELMLLESASRLPTVSGDIDRKYILGLPNRVRWGELEALQIAVDGELTGVFCYRNVDNEAELVYGCIRRGGRINIERPLMKEIIHELETRDIHAIRSSFSWPGSEQFITAALETGFRKIGRMSMSRNVDPGHALPRPGSDTAILPWSPTYFENVCKIMYEASEHYDRAVYPLFGSIEGARRLLLSILQDRHGLFMPDLSMVAQKDGRIAGFLLSALLPDGCVLILDIAVDSDFRRHGIGSQMLENLVNKSATLDRNQIVLAVTRDNNPAIALYLKAGFKEIAHFDQYVLEIKPEPPRQETPF